jgi:hypothetical protein
MARPTLYLNPADAASYTDGEALAVAVGGETFDVQVAVNEFAPAGLGLLRGVPGARPMGLEPAIISRRPSAEMVAAD